ncbi:MAG: hypothetical protein ACRD0K_00460 [Egibacteraceae bacterium]
MLARQDASAPTPIPSPQLPEITTPQPINARVNPDGSANLQVNRVNVVLKPDVHSSDIAMSNQAKTTFDISYGAIKWTGTSGTISYFTGPGTPHVAIQTTYGPGATRSSPSGYGRGTTPADVAAGDTSIGFHEGRHGLDLIEFLSQNPFPRFTGGKGMTIEQFKRARTAYYDAIARYRENMDRYATLQNDCVGKTIDQHNRENGFTTSICQQVPAAPKDKTP